MLDLPSYIYGTRAMPNLPSLAAAVLIGLTLPAPLLTAPADAAEALAAEQSAPFEQWLEAFTHKARNAGIEGWVLEQAFTGLTPDSSIRSEEHTSELQSRPHLVCRLLLEK